MKSILLITSIAALSLLSGCASTGGISPQQITAAEQAAQPIVTALAASNPSDAAAINAGWAIASALASGAAANSTTSPALASLPPGTSNGSAIAAVNTAIAIIGTPGATQAARSHQLDTFLAHHRIQPAQRVLFTADDQKVFPTVVLR